MLGKLLWLRWLTCRQHNSDNEEQATQQGSFSTSPHSRRCPQKLLSEKQAEASRTLEQPALEEISLPAYAKAVQALLDGVLQGQMPPEYSRVVRGSLKLDFYDWDKVHGETSDLRTRLIFGCDIVRTGLVRTVLEPLLQRTIQATLGTTGRKIRLTKVDTEAGPIGLGVITGQPLTGDVVLGLLKYLKDAPKKYGFKAVCLIAGDSLYAFVPWKKEDYSKNMADRARSTVRFFYREHGYQRITLGKRGQEDDRPECAQLGCEPGRSEVSSFGAQTLWSTA